MINIVIYGVVPTYLILSKPDWWWWIGYVILLLIYWHQKKVARYIAAASNIVAAKATFNNLSPDQQSEVEQSVVRTIHSSGGRSNVDLTSMNEAQRYGWYALGMRELGMKPMHLIPEWNIVRNPYIEPPRVWIESSMHRLKNNEGVHVYVAEGATPLAFDHMHK